MLRPTGSKIARSNTGIPVINTGLHTYETQTQARKIVLDARSGATAGASAKGKASSHASTGPIDIAICILGILLFYYSLPNISSYSWTQAVAIKHVSHVVSSSTLSQLPLPLPIITDVDHDNRKELVCIVHEDSHLSSTSYLAVYLLPSSASSEWKKSISRTISTAAKVPQRSLPDANSNEIALKWKISLADTLGLTTDTIIIAIASAPIAWTSSSPSSPLNSTAINDRHIIVLLTNAASIICVDGHTQAILWTKRIKINLSFSYIAEASILVLPTPLRRGDKGSIFVGIRLHPYHFSDSNPIEQNTMGSTIENTNPFINATQKADIDDGDDDQDEELSSHDADTHFSYYAYDVSTGNTRWKHESGDFVDSNPLQTLMGLHEIHSGEVDWRKFRDSVISMLPHMWMSTDNTALRPALVERMRSGHAKKGSEDSTKFTLSLNPGATSKHPNVLVAYLKEGLEFIHIYTGRPITYLMLKHGQLHADINGDGVIEHIEAWGKQQSHGVSMGGFVTSRYSADSSDYTSHVIAPKCVAIATSHVPPTTQLFASPICMTGYEKFLMAIHMGAGGHLPFVKPPPLLRQKATVGRHIPYEEVDADDLNHMEGSSDQSDDYIVAPPLALRELTLDLSSIKLPKQYELYFFLQSGVVTVLNATGAFKASFQTDAQWEGYQRLHEEPDDDDDEIVAFRNHFHERRSFLPSLTSYPLRANGVEDALIAIGSHAISVISRSHTILATWDLPGNQFVIAHPIIGDLDNDGYNDFIILTNEGYIVYSMHIQVGSFLFWLLYGSLVAFMVSIIGLRVVSVLFHHYYSKLVASLDDVPEVSHPSVRNDFEVFSE